MWPPSPIPPFPAAAACPGTPACSGHGKCLSLRALGEEPNAEPVGPPRPYGGDPEGATWDEDKIQACVCDSGWAVGYAGGQTQAPQWTGHDCLQQRCPSGDDPRTYAVDETDCELFDDNGRVWKGIVGSDGKRYKSAGALPAGVTIATPASCTPGVDCGAPGTPVSTNTVPAGPGAVGHGVALANVRDRLNLLHDVEAQFRSGLHDGVYRVRMEVPA